MIRVLVADDHTLFREGLVRLLEEAPDVEVVASVASGEEALQALERTRPDVVLMDLNMPGLGGLQAIAQAAARFPSVGILALTISESEADLVAAIRAARAGICSSGRAAPR